MTGTPQPRIELFVRSLFPEGAFNRQEEVLDRLETLDAADRIEGFSVVVWGNRIAHETAGTRSQKGRYVLNRVAEFEAWALSNNVTLDTFHRTTEVDSEVTGETYTVTTLPVMGLAEYEDGQLTHVAPCTDGDAVHTIVDRLEELEAGEPPTVGAAAGSVRIA